MFFVFKRFPGYLRAEIFRRETAEETKRFLDATAAECLRTGARSVLISVRASRPIFMVDTYCLGKYLGFAALESNAKVALVADSQALKASQQYVELLATQRGANVRAFADERAAVEWLDSTALPIGISKVPAHSARVPSPR